MRADVLLFFQGHMEALPLYEQLEKRILAKIANTRLKVQKSQISFYNRCMFACVSFAKVRKKQDCPPAYIVITFGLNRRVESERIDAITEPYPNRWTHHMLVAKVEELDDELMMWLKEAAAFSAIK